MIPSNWYLGIMGTKPTVGATSPSAAAAVGDESLTAMGFDVTSPALDVITDPETRIRLLTLFRDEHRGSSTIVRESLASDSHEAARNILHKLMGTTATVGLSDLRGCVLALQAEIHSDDSTIDDAVTDRFIDELDRIIAALDVLG